MDYKMADTIVAWAMIPLGLLGMLLWARALDLEMHVFGMSLTAFAALFGFAQIRHLYDDEDAARVTLHSGKSRDVV